MDGRDHVRRAIRHYIEKDDDLRENSEDPARLNRSIQAAFTLARAAVSAARDIRDMVLRLPAAEPGRPSGLHRHYEAVWTFLGSLWELIDFCELEQEVATSDVEDPVWFFGRALDQHLGGNPLETLAVLDESGLTSGTADPWVQMLRAEALAATGEQEAAIAAWEAAAALDPLLVPAHVSVAGELEAAGRDREAFAHWLAVKRALPKDDPLAGEAKRHLTRLGQRLEKKVAEERPRTYERLPRWGPSWVPAWPGRGRPAAEGDEPSPVDGGTAPDDAATGGALRSPFRGLVRVGRLESVLGLSDARDHELTVYVAGSDPVDEGVLRSRVAVYLGGARLAGAGVPVPASIEREEPDLVVLASGISAEQCAALAERARSGALRSRAGPVEFLFNGPAEMRDDLAVIFEDLPLDAIPDICDPRGDPGQEPEDEPPATAPAAAAETGPPADPERAGPLATEAAIDRRVRERLGGKPAPRRILACGSLGLAPVLDWLDSGERRHSGRKPPYDLISVIAEPRAVETIAVRAGQAVGVTYGPGGDDRGRLLEELFEDMPKLLPSGDLALLMGRLLGESGPSRVAEGAEALAASGLAAGVLARAVLGLRQTLAADAPYGVRSSHLLVGGSLLSRLPGPEYALLAAADGCQPAGVTRVLLDPYGIMAALGDGLTTGRLAPDDPSWADGTAALLAGSCLVVAPLVQAVKWGKPGRHLVLEVAVKGAWREGVRTWQVCRGELVWVPLPAGRRIELIVRPQSPYSVGRGRGVEWRGEFVAGGLGLLLDGRGRPLKLPAAEPDRTTLRAAWASELVGKTRGR